MMIMFDIGHNQVQIDRARSMDLKLYQLIDTTIVVVATESDCEKYSNHLVISKGKIITEIPKEWKLFE